MSIVHWINRGAVYTLCGRKVKEAEEYATVTAFDALIKYDEDVPRPSKHTCLDCLDRREGQIKLPLST